MVFKGSDNLGGVGNLELLRIKVTSEDETSPLGSLQILQNGSATPTGTFGSDGNLGIGTTTPLAALDVRKASGIRTTQICDENGGNCKDLSNGWGTVGDMLGASNLSDLANASTAHSNLGVAIGTHVQAYNAGLASISGSDDRPGQDDLYDGGEYLCDDRSDDIRPQSAGRQQPRECPHDSRCPSSQRGS